MSNTLPLPEPWDYCYEWNGPFGTRKFSAASYNGNRPDRSVPIYTADQMHAHAAAVSAAKDAEIERLRAEVAALREDAERYRWLRQHYAALTRMEIARGLGLDLSRVYVNTAEKFDAAIDAARAKGGA